MTEHDDVDASWPALETVQSILISMTAMVAAAAPLALPVMIAILALMTLAERWHQAGPVRPYTGQLTLNLPALTAIAFIAFATLSTLWSVKPSYSLKSLAQASLVGMASWHVAITVSQQMEKLGKVRRIRFLRALSIPALIIALYFSIEYLTGDAVTLFFARNFPSLFDGFENTFVYDANQKLVGLDDSYFNRIAAALTLLTVAIVGSFQFWPSRKLGVVLGIVVSIGMITVCLKSGSATAVLVFSASALVFAFALWSSKAATRILQAALIIITAAAIPLSMVPKSLSLDINENLPTSFRERAVIWHDVAHMALERPWFGFGVKSLKFTQRWEPRREQASGAAATKLRTYAHPHNGYLQVWVELGVVGAILFALAGWCALNEIMFLPQAMQKFALALAAGTLTVIGPAWDIWQPWLIAAIGFSWIALMMLRAEFELT